MSDPSIYIELHGKTSHVPPRYIPLMCRPCAPPQSAIIWCGIPKSPYPIRNSEFGNQNSETGDLEIMVRLSGPLPSILVA